MPEKKCVLIVEDDWVISAELARVVESAGLDVIGPVSSVEHALRLVQSDEPAAALLDIDLGGENSFPLAERLEALDIPFLFVSGYTEIRLPPQLDGHEIIPKPVPEERLLAAVRQMTTRTKSGA